MQGSLDQATVCEAMYSGDSLPSMYRPQDTIDANYPHGPTILAAIASFSSRTIWFVISRTKSCGTTKPMPILHYFPAPVVVPTTSLAPLGSEVAQQDGVVAWSPLTADVNPSQKQ